LLKNETMKFVLIAFFMAFMHVSFAQPQVITANVTPFFVQGLFPDMNDENVRVLETEIRQMDYVQLARLDIHTKRFFIITKDISQFDELTVRSWFSKIGDELECIQIGVQGIDSVNPFPFVNCQN
jgi:hypothetical protein